MASLYVDVVLPVPALEMWDRVRDFGAVHEKLTPGLVTQCTLDDGVRTVTFADGFEVREALAGCDDARMRIAYGAVGGRATHHNAAMQIVEEDGRHSRLEWWTDILPDALAPFVSERMKNGIDAIRAAVGVPSLK